MRNKPFVHASLSNARSTEGNHVMQCIEDCRYELNRIIDLANQDSITEEELKEFRISTQTLVRRATALRSWSDDLSVGDWTSEDSDYELGASYMKSTRHGIQAMAHTIVDLQPYGKVVDITIKGDAEQEAIAQMKGIEKLRAAEKYIRLKVPQKINTADNFAVEVNKEFVKKLRDPKTKRPTQTAHASMELNGLIEASEIVSISNGKSHTSSGNKFAQEFAYFRTYFRLWGQVYSAILNVGVSYENNVEVLKLYAITKITQV